MHLLREARTALCFLQECQKKTLLSYVRRIQRRIHPILSIHRLQSWLLL